MNTDTLDLLGNFISSTYLHQARASRNSVCNDIKSLLAQRKLPEDGWSEGLIEIFIREVSLWDSNNFPDKSAVGEREGRCFSKIVRRRHWGLVHGIGRSGDVNAEQPKAAGSSFLLSLTRILVRDALKSVFGLTNIPKEVIVLPVATGMALMLGMTAISQMHMNPTRRNVIWSRIDQKSCIKAATFDPSLNVHVVEQRNQGEGFLSTDIEAIASLLSELGPETIHSVVLTTSTFSPRTPDDVPSVAKICKDLGIALVVNNAYGLQCTKCCHLVNEAIRVGRVDLVVQSTDKNFGVPVGGSILFGPAAEFANKIYPGRASMSPILDLLITLLELGNRRLKELLVERKETFAYMISKLQGIEGVTVLNIPKNQISLTLTVDSSSVLDEELGSELFLRNVSGCRVFVRSDKMKNIDRGIPPMRNFGCHSSEPIVDRYINVACAIGSTKLDVDLFVSRLTGLLKKRRTSQIAPSVCLE
jgi:O-phospho-L-seryl-tRNASec:L-selenocysteinyl-tRNA synthase